MSLAHPRDSSRPGRDPSAPRRRPRLFTFASATAVALWLAACGGGGGGGGTVADQVLAPPTTAAVLGTSANDAVLAVQAAVSAGDAMVKQTGAVQGMSGLFDAPLALGRAVTSAARAQVQAVTTQSCFAVMEGPTCVGTVVVDSTLSDTSTVARPGDFVSLNFQGLGGTLLGQFANFNGGMRLDFLSTLDLNAASFDGVDMVITFNGFGGALGGIPFGPLNESARLQVGAQGGATITAQGRTFTGLGGVRINGADAYSITGGSVRAAYWGDSNRYMNLDLGPWNISGGRPDISSRAAVTAGGQTLTISVNATSADTVVYRIGTFTAGGTATYAVTATYPVGAGAPTYSVVELR